MKINLWLMLEATVICTLAVLVVAPSVDGQGGSSKATPLTSAGNAGPDPVNTGNSGTGTSPTPAPSTPHSNSNNSLPSAQPGAAPNSSRPITKESNCTVNGTDCTDNSIGALLSKNKGMLQRAVYVLVAVTVVILVYFGLRTWSTRKRRSKTKKYGLITTPASDLEMTPLDQEDDDEDMTVFEVNGLHK